MYLLKKKKAKIEHIPNENVDCEFICGVITHKSEHLYILMHLIYTQGRHWECSKILQKKKLKGPTVLWNLKENWPKCYT